MNKNLVQSDNYVTVYLSQIWCSSETSFRSTMRKKFGLLITKNIFQTGFSILQFYFVTEKLVLASSIKDLVKNLYLELYNL